jgi:hemoglobin
MNTNAQAALFDRIGGVKVVQSLVDEFYARVLADPKLLPYFYAVPMDKLRRMQFEFFSAALDGPIRYSGRSMIHAHQGHGITREHFHAFVGHLFDTLQDLDLSADDRYAIISRVNIYVDDIVNGGVGLDT